ncbi:MAG: hypothetical protein KJ630_21875 [Proteobacteria bacterium]|nr:hypothetical protein [Pseudomonadota bacterium]
MKDPHDPDKPRSRVKTWKKSTLFFMIALISIVISSFFLFMRFKHSEIIHAFGENIITTSTKQDPIVSKVPENTSKTPETHPIISSQSPFFDHTTIPGGDDVSIKSERQPQNLTLVQNQSTIEKTTGQALITDPYQQLVDDLNAFYSHLDKQPYMQDFHLKEPSKNHFSKLLQVLIDNPPAITRETDDYFTLLKNTAHFYRVLGKDNIFILKGILDREKASFERILKSFYALTDHPEYLKKEFSLTIPKDSLYDYAGFFLNTIGGRLYLFRRDSASRMTVSYYAVLIIDKANRRGDSRLGIDLRPAINSLIEEIENGGNHLKFKDDYLDTLYDLKEKYDNRG